MNVAEAYGILHLPKGAGSDEVKAAYRKLAFELHPDLNPDDPSASRRFQLLNEAYVLLKQVLEEEPPAAAGAGRKRRKAAQKDEKPTASQAEASREYARQAGATPPPGSGANAGAKAAGNGPTFTFRKEEVLRDIMSDPFARRVFEDIYRTVRQSGRAGTPVPPVPKERKLTLRWGGKSVSVDLSKGVVGGVKDWLAKSMDDEQTIEIPAHQLTPGARIRLTIRRAWTGEPKTVEVPLPPDYVPGRPLRLKGLGRKLGPWAGDLYIRLVAK